jgi:hypothetical protein
VAHLTLVNTNTLTTALAVLGVEPFEAGAAVRPALTHNVSLPAEIRVAFVAREMLHVPASTFGFRAFIREDDLEMAQS